VVSFRQHQKVSCRKNIKRRQVFVGKMAEKSNKNGKKLGFLSLFFLQKNVIFEILRKTTKTRAIGSYFAQKQRGTVCAAEQGRYIKWV